MPSNVLLIDSVHPEFIQLMNKNGIEVTEGFQLSKDEIINRIENYDGLVIRSRFMLDADFMAKAKGRIKCIGRAGAGMENIDVNAARAAGIACINTPEGNRDAVAEHALGMLLNLTNHLNLADKEVRKRTWRREENRGNELMGKTIGIVGFGNMGSAFAQRMTGFGVRILALDPYIRINKNIYPDIMQCEEELFFNECDVVSLHVPLTDTTRYMVNDNWLSNFRKPIWMINTARGKNVDTAALIRAIESGKVKGAALDVLEFESISFENLDEQKLPPEFLYLIQSDKVILTPHIAGWTHESNIKISQFLAMKMLPFLK